MEDILFAAKAFAVVMAGMSAIMAFLYMLRFVAQLVEARAAQQPGASPHELNVADEPELVAVLAAAAHTALGAPVRIHQIHMFRQPSVETWARAGRMDIMFSHRVDRKR